MQPLLTVACVLVLSLHAADDRAVDGGGGSCSSETLLPSGGRCTRSYIIKDHVKRKPWPKEGDGFALPATKLDQPVVLTGTRYAARSSLRWWTPARLAEKIPGGRMENVKRYAMLPCLASHSTPQCKEVCYAAVLCCRALHPTAHPNPNLPQPAFAARLLVETQCCLNVAFISHACIF